MKFGAIAALAALSVTLLGASSATGVTGATVPVINTFAGGTGGPDPATNVSLQIPAIFPSGGSLYIQNGVNHPAPKQVSQSTDWLSNTRYFVMGTDTYGNKLFSGNSEIKVVAAHTGAFYGQQMVAGKAYTVAGDGAFGYSGDGGPARLASLMSPVAVQSDPSGNLVIADYGSYGPIGGNFFSGVRVVAVKSGTFYGQSMKAGDIYTVFNRDTHDDLWDQVAMVDRWGNLVIAARGPFSNTPGEVWVLAEQTGKFYGQQMTKGVYYPLTPLNHLAGSMGGLVLDGAGNIVFSDGNTLVKVLAASTGTYYGQKMTAGQVYTIAGGGTSTADGVPALQAAIGAGAVAADASGNVYVVDGASGDNSWGMLVRVIAAKTGTLYGKTVTAGDIYTIAGNGRLNYSGDGGPATSAELNIPTGAVTDAAGNTILADAWNNALRVVAGQTGTFYGQHMTKGDIYTIAQIIGHPTISAIDSAGNLIVGRDYGAGNGPVMVVAEKSGTFYGQQMTAGGIYTIPNLQGFPVSIDQHGNLVLTRDVNGPNPTARVDVFAVSNGSFYGQTMQADKIYTVAGSTPGTTENGVPALDADLNGLQDTIVDPAGNLVLSTTASHIVIRVVAEKTGKFYGQAMTAGDIYTIAGTGTAGAAGDGGPALQAELGAPVSLAIDGAGNILVSDQGENKIRVIAVKSGTFYDQAMTAEYIYRLAGTGASRYFGDGGPAASAGMSVPRWVTVTPSGGILVIDDNRLRLITG